MLCEGFRRKVAVRTWFVDGEIVVECVVSGGLLTAGLETPKMRHGFQLLFLRVPVM
jgi:hypothetical protein